MCVARCFVVAVAVGLVASTAWSGVPSTQPVADPGDRTAVVEVLDRMPLLFVPEQVSPDGAMGFAVRRRETSIWLSRTGIAYRLDASRDHAPAEGAGSWVVAVDLVGAEPRQPVGEDPLPTRVSYFKGPKEAWRTGLPSYGSVRYREPWPGVDLVVSGTAGELESTFVVRPGADPGAVRLAYRGATSVRLEADGSLVVDTPLGAIREKPPFAYQEIDGRRVEVAAAFELDRTGDPGRHPYRFRLGDYDPTRELVVDPVTLIYCGYIGGSEADSGFSIAVGGDGAAYVLGDTGSTEATFPVTVGPDATYNGGVYDVFVAKLSADGSALVYCGYIGGSESDVGYGIAVDTAGNAYVTGSTDSTEATFPVVVGPDLTHNGFRDSFVAKVSPDGTALEYCGYIGGSNDESGTGIAVDAVGNAYVTGSTWTGDGSFPAAVGPDLSFNGERDAFVAKVNAAGTALEYCGFIGGSDNDTAAGIAVDAQGNAYVAGRTFSTESTFPVTVGPGLNHSGDWDGFVAKVGATGADFEYCGYIGGSDRDNIADIAVDAAGSAYVTGDTASTESTFPVKVGPDLSYNGSGGYYGDTFVAKVNAAGNSLEYCGYVGGSGEDFGTGIAVDAAGNAFITGGTDSAESTFPATAGPDLSFNGGRDAFVARVNATGTGLDYCGYIGGSGNEYGNGIAADGAGNAYVTGVTASTEASFPVAVGPELVYGGGDDDAFVAKVSFSNIVESFFPAAAVAAGAEGAFFQTDVEVNNTGAGESQVVFRWLPRGQDNSEPLESEPVALAPGRSLRWDNVLRSLFGLEPDAVGALAMVADSAGVIGMSRTYNVPGAKLAGTFGQGLPAVGSTGMIAGTGPRRIIFLSEDTDSRANVGCVNATGDPVRISLAVFDASGTQLGRRTMNLGPYSNNQINRVLEDWQPVNGYVEVSADSGGALYFCYGSMLDNQTSDPTTILPQAPSDEVSYIPAAALAAGLAGAFFQTDVDLVNAGSGELSYQLLWLPRGADNSDPTRSGTFTLGPGAGVRYGNVLEEVFGLEADRVGALAVEASGTGLLAMSRTYNVPGAKIAGTFGQELPGVPAGRMIPTGARKRIIFMNENDDVRSNVGCQNAGTETVTVSIELFNADGESLEVKTMNLKPSSNSQITRVFQDHAPITAGYVDVWTDTPGAAIYCYGSVLDNLTSDPTTVLPQ